MESTPGNLWRRARRSVAKASPPSGLQTFVIHLRGESDNFRDHAVNFREHAVNFRGCAVNFRGYAFN
jgi:hypothetical protein